MHVNTSLARPAVASGCTFAVYACGVMFHRETACCATAAVQHAHNQKQVLTLMIANCRTDGLACIQQCLPCKQRCCSMFTCAVVPCMLTSITHICRSLRLELLAERNRLLKLSLSCLQLCLAR